MKKYLLLFSVLLVMLSVGCELSEIVEQSPIAVKEKKPDIRVTASSFSKSYSLSEGAYSTGSYTLTNYGDADGYATVTFIGDFSGTITEETVFVPAQNSVTKNVRLDIRREDNTVDVKVVRQSKAS